MADDSRCSYAEKLPRLCELKALADQLNPDNYFRDFERRFEQGRTVLSVYQTLERMLSELDETAWHDLEARAASVAHVYVSGRGWQELFDALGEARGYGYLKSLGCTGIAFIPRTQKKTPDLGANLDGTRVLCEVKTINPSQEEAGRRARMAEGQFVSSVVLPELATEMLNKVRCRLQAAISQLDAEDPHHTARRIVFSALYFDDWVGDCYQEYVDQLDGDLLAHPVAGAELAFCIPSDPFERRYTMRAATFVNN
jgi:hypothetical protein